MKKLLIGLILICSVSSFANSQSDKILEIQEIINSHERGIDNYHYGRLKGYLEALNLSNGFILPNFYTDSSYRMHLVALKEVLESVQKQYPDADIKKTVKSIAITGAHNSSGGCMLYGKNLAVGYKDKEQQFTIGVQGDYLGKDFNKYTKPVISKCSKVLLDGVEANLEY